MTVAAANASLGHAALAPLHRSSTSHTDTDARHTVIGGRNVSGHAPAAVQKSGASQAPTAARH